MLSEGKLPPNMKSGEKSSELLVSIQEFLEAFGKGKKQVPMVRTQYMRSAFQEATSNAVR